MEKSIVIRDLLEKQADKNEIITIVIDDPHLINELISILLETKGTLKYTSEKILRAISETSPDLIYPFFAAFAELLDSENSFLKWGAIITISNLIKVDAVRQFDTILKRYFAPVQGPVLVTAANIVSNAWKIALARPDLSDMVVSQLLSVENAVYINKGNPSPECNNIIRGQAIESFNNFYDEIKDKDKVTAFVKRQRDNSRNAVKKKAEKFLRKYA